MSISTTLTNTFKLNQIGIPFTQGDDIIVKLKISGSSTSNFTASLGAGSLSITSNIVSTGYNIVECSALSPFLQTGSNTNEIGFNTSLSSLYGGNYQFVPNPADPTIFNTPTSSLYSLYGEVDYPFVSEVFDIVIIMLEDNSIIELRVIGISEVNNQVYLALDSPLSLAIRNSITNKTFKRFLLLKRVKDETNAFLTFKKRNGLTSYGFIIPDDLAPDVLANIDTITSQVKQKLLADQQGLTNDPTNTIQ